MQVSNLELKKFFKNCQRHSDTEETRTQSVDSACSLTTNNAHLKILQTFEVENNNFIFGIFWFSTDLDSSHKLENVMILLVVNHIGPI